MIAALRTQIIEKALEEVRAERAEEIRAFHDLFYTSGAWGNTKFFHTPVRKCPFDLWVMQEIIFETRPEIIVETGTYQGGSALFFAAACDVLGRGEVLTIDTNEDAEIDLGSRPKHPRITYMIGSSIASEIVAQVRERIEGKSTMVTLDSDHSQAHVLMELRAYAPLVSAGHYLIIEDTNTPGPAAARDEFLRDAPPFEVDRAREKFLLTFNPCGYLRRLGAL